MAEEKTKIETVGTDEKKEIEEINWNRNFSHESALKVLGIGSQEFDQLLKKLNILHYNIGSVKHYLPQNIKKIKDHLEASKKKAR